MTIPLVQLSGTMAIRIRLRGMSARLTHGSFPFGENWLSTQQHLSSRTRVSSSSFVRALITLQEEPLCSVVLSVGMLATRYGTNLTNYHPPQEMKLHS